MAKESTPSLIKKHGYITLNERKGRQDLVGKIPKPEGGFYGWLEKVPLNLYSRALRIRAEKMLSLMKRRDR